MPDPYSAAGEGNPYSQEPSQYDAPGQPTMGDTAAPTDATAVESNPAENNVATPTQSSWTPQHPAATPETLKQVEGVLKSEIGVSTLLNRLKQSIASTKEFGLFLKKRSAIEDDHAQNLKKLSRMTQDNMRRADHRHGSFLYGYEEMMQMHDRMADNGAQFAVSLHQMHEDLFELASFADRSRKGLKASGLAAEQKVADLEQAMRKSKAKYDSLSEEYERARTGEVKQSARFAFKSKTGAQHEEELLRKVQTADQNYQSSVQLLQSEKSQLENMIRPDNVKQLQDLVRETDAGLTLQLQKFASFNEKLLLSNGLIISPLRTQPGEAVGASRSLRQAVASINNDKDFNDFVSSQHTRVAHGTGDVKYEKNPAFASHTHSSSQNSFQPFNASPATHPTPFSRDQRSNTVTSFTSPVPPVVEQQLSPAAPPSNPAFSPQTSSMDREPQQPPASYPQDNHVRQNSAGGIPPSGQQPYPPTVQQTPQQQQPQQAAPRFGNGVSINTTGPPQLGALPFQGNSSPIHPSPHQFSPQETRSPGGMLGSSLPPPGSRGSPQTVSAGPTKPAFGIPLNRLYERDGMAVPLVVQQCIQAVELYGLELEGIYRQSGSLTHIQKLKGMFDTDATNKALDFRNPENFFEDVNSVAGLLKQFFRDLPDPLLTMEHHDALINAAKRDDDIVRRDSLHAIINNLPDPNYATLRALALHLYRVMDKASFNRMNSHNLAVIFGPTLMGTDPSTAITDAGWQIRVIDTILQNTYQIFDED